MVFKWACHFLEMRGNIHVVLLVAAGLSVFSQPGRVLSRGFVVKTKNKGSKLYRGAQAVGILFIIGAWASAPSAQCPLTAFVTEIGGGKLSAVDIATGAITLVTADLSEPRGVVLNSAGTTAFVAESPVAGGKLSAVDLSNGDVILVALGLSRPIGVALNSTETILFVAEQSSGEVSAIDLATGAITLVAGGLSGPTGITLNTAETTAYVTEESTGELSAVDLATGEITFITGGLSKPIGVALNAAETTAYVVEGFSLVAGSGELSAVDLGTGTTILVTAGLRGPRGLTLNAAETIAYVTGLTSGELSAVHLTMVPPIITLVAAGLDLPEGLFITSLPIPAEVRDLRLEVSAAGPSEAILTWDPNPLATAYHVYRGEQADLSDLSCFLPDLLTTTASDDGTLLPLSGVFLYLVTATNVCGE